MEVTSRTNMQQVHLKGLPVAIEKKEKRDTEI
jgi:hypothetical protein